MRQVLLSLVLMVAVVPMAFGQSGITPPEVEVMEGPVDPTDPTDYHEESITFSEPPVAIDPNGDYIIAWSYSIGGIADNPQLIGYRFYWANGNDSGFAEDSGNNSGTVGLAGDIAQHLDVGLEDGGHAIIVWEAAVGVGPYNTTIGRDIRGMRVSRAGTPLAATLGKEFDVNINSTAGEQGSPSVAVDGAGNVVVVWNRPDSLTVEGQRFHISGEPTLGDGGDFIVDVDDPATPPEEVVEVIGQYPRVASATNGEHVITWTNGAEIYFKRFGPPPANTPGTTVKVASGGHTKLSPDIAIDDQGRVVVIFRVSGYGFGSDVMMQVFDPDDSPVGSPGIINRDPTVDVIRPRVDMNDAGSFVVGWTSDNGDDVWGYFSEAGPCSSPCTGTDLQLNIFEDGLQDSPGVARGPDDMYVFAWHSPYDPALLNDKYVVARPGNISDGGDILGGLIFSDNFESDSLWYWSSYTNAGVDTDPPPPE